MLIKRLFALSLLFNLWFISRVMRPLQQLSTRTSRLAQGDLTALEESCGGIREIGELRHTMATMAQHVQRAQSESLTYRHALTDGQEAERARIAHELHDDTVQSFVAIAQSIELAMHALDSDTTRAKTMLEMARLQAVESVTGLRRLIADLRPPALEELGVAAALKMLADDRHHIVITGSERRIGMAQELALFRIAQEAVRNAERHGSASRISIHLDFQPLEIRLQIQDDGVGFKPPRLLDTLAQESHFGLIGIAERVEQLSGRFEIRSQPGEGTTICVSLPLNNTDQPTEEVRDPVCGALIMPDKAYGSTVYNEERHYFCCPVCQGAFQSNPELYLIPHP
jgi:signal transduction histidine kinase/YHS domain-containing protein